MRAVVKAAYRVEVGSAISLASCEAEHSRAAGSPGVRSPKVLLAPWFRLMMAISLLTIKTGS